MSCVKSIIITICSGILFLGNSVPVEDMTRSTFGIEYSGLLSGQTITKAEVASRFQTHYFMIHYSPISFLLLSAGIGGSSFETDVYNLSSFNGKAGFSPTAGLHLVSPELISHIAITGGSSVSLINSKNERFSYSTVFISPDAGILFYAGPILDFSIGVKGQILTGTMKGPSASSSFSNNNYVRGFLSATLHSSSSGSYATFTFDISPKSSTDWSYTPNEASFGVQVGYLIKQQFRNAGPKNAHKSNKTSKDIDNMKRLQDKMSDDIKERD
jgi:hypothetical protein